MRTPRLALATLAALLAAGTAAACPFCTSQGQTLSGDADQAAMILFGKLENPKLQPTEVSQGTTDLNIETVIKNNDILAGRKVLTLPKYVPVPKNGDAWYLVYCDVYEGRIDPYRGVPVKKDSDIVKYLQGAFAVKGKDAATRLTYFFDYLEAKDPEISGDAYMEFGNADYKEYRPLAEKLPPDVVLKWMQDPNTSPSRFGLYGSILGHCGKPEHAAGLRALLDDPKRRYTSGLDGMLAGYVLLDKKAGWDYVRGLLADPTKEFMVQYAALRAVRFFHDHRPDVIPAKDQVEAAKLLLSQRELADLAVEDLRKWQAWDAADAVLGVWGKEGFDLPIVKRSVLRYALSCPADKSPKAAQFVAAQKARDAKWVKDVEELLELENAKPATPPASAEKPKRPAVKTP